MGPVESGKGNIAMSRAGGGTGPCETHLCLLSDAYQVRLLSFQEAGKWAVIFRCWLEHTTNCFVSLEFSRAGGTRVILGLCP